MPGKSCSAAQIVVKLREVEIRVVQGKAVAVVCCETEVNEHSYYRWRKEYGGCAAIRRRSRNSSTRRTSGGRSWWLI